MTTPPTPEDEYKWLNNRLDFLEAQIASQRQKEAVLQAEYNKLAERMQTVFGIVHAGNSW